MGVSASNSLSWPHMDQFRSTFHLNSRALRRMAAVSEITIGPALVSCSMALCVLVIPSRPFGMHGARAPLVPLAPCSALAPCIGISWSRLGMGFCLHGPPLGWTRLSKLGTFPTVSSTVLDPVWLSSTDWLSTATLTSARSLSCVHVDSSSTTIDKFILCSRVAQHNVMVE